MVGRCAGTEFGCCADGTTAARRMGDTCKQCQPFSGPTGLSMSASDLNELCCASADDDNSGRDLCCRGSGAASAFLEAAGGDIASQARHFCGGTHAFSSPHSHAMSTHDPPHWHSVDSHTSSSNSSVEWWWVGGAALLILLIVAVCVVLIPRHESTK
jgi:hypothetical protein